MNDMYEKGYQDGYLNGHKDGFVKGWEENRRQKQALPNPFDKEDNKCPKCKVSFEGAVGYVCMSPNCPLKSYAG